MRPRSLLRVARQASPWRTLAVGVAAALALVLVVSASGALLLDRPVTRVGPGARDGSSFPTVTGGGRSHTVVVTRSTPTANGRRRYRGRADGTRVGSP